MTVERKKITDFTPDPSNANQGTERGLRVLDDSIAQTGLGRSIVVDKAGRIIAGNKTQERAIDSGFDEAIVVHTDGKQLVVVQRDDLDLSDTTGTARKLAYYDNRAGELGLSWSADQILADLNAGVDLSAMFTGYELDDLLKYTQPPDDWKEYDETAADDVQYCECPNCGHRFPK